MKTPARNISAFRRSGMAGLGLALSLSSPFTAGLAQAQDTAPKSATEQAAKPASKSTADALLKTIQGSDAAAKAQALTALETAAASGDAKAAAAAGKLYGDGKLVERDVAKALKFATIAYDAGDTSVAGLLGRLYYRDFAALQVDQAKALVFFEKGAAAGDAWSMSSLADVYREGKIVAKDMKKALDLYEQALAKGNASVVGKIGDIYYRSGEALGLDRSKALAFYQQGTDADDPWAMAGLADVYREGKIVPQDLKKAFDLYEQALAKGNDGVRGKLGDLHYRNASALGLDPAKAVAFYQQGADAGDAWAMASLADVYRDGKVVPKDLPKALDLYTQALEKGNTSVVGKLGDLYYRNGAALGLDPAKAVGYYEQGAAAGDAWAKASLADVYREGKVVAPDYPKALTLYKEALEGGNTSVLSKIGNLYYRNAADLGADPKEALPLLEKGTADGDAWAMASLGDIYREGKIVPKDLNKALELYTAALDKGNTSVVGKLGNLYYRNADELKVDPAKAIDFFKQGADSGDAWAMASLADVYREGKIVPADTATASELYEKSYAGGNQGAYVAEAAMLLRGTPAQQKRGLTMVKAGLSQDIPGMVPVWAEAHLFGRGMPRNPQKALQILKQASAKGDVQATFRLAALYIQGYGKAIARSQTQAAKLLKSLEGKADADRIAAERLYLQGAFAASQGELKAFAAAMSKLPADTQSSMVSRISWANANTYVYMVQTTLKARGQYKGPVNGQLTGSTIKAMYSVCRAVATQRGACEDGPLSEKARQILSDYIKQAES
ncbi:tetratricopeptide repeat protein [Rhizobium sp. SG2393]|uniref:tetratricopeptide repeat protein n=1 Tax=Rhizobium sp. SG2393 TaxID=3276279 RepID=UPI003672FB36